MSAPEAMSSGGASYNTHDSGGEENGNYSRPRPRGYDIQEDDDLQEDGD